MRPKILSRTKTLTPVKNSLFQCAFEVSVVVMRDDHYTQVCAIVLRTLHGPREFLTRVSKEDCFHTEILFAIELDASSLHKRPKSVKRGCGVAMCVRRGGYRYNQPQYCEYWCGPNIKGKTYMTITVKSSYIHHIC